MATARAITSIPTPPPEVTGVILQLDKDEAQFLIDILAKVAGDMRHSRRKHQTAISQALRSAGFKSQHPPIDITGGIRMTDFPF